MTKMLLLGLSAILSALTCVSFAQNSLINTLFDASDILCEYNNKTYANNETWFVENFLFQCQTHPGGWKADIISCRWSRTNESLAVNESKTFKKWSARCYREGDTVKWEERELNLRNREANEINTSPEYPEGLTCEHGSEFFQPHQEWEVGNFALRCEVAFLDGKWSWDVQITGCKWPRNGVYLALNQTKSVGVYTARCYEDVSGTVKFEESESLPVQSRGQFEIKSPVVPADASRLIACLDGGCGYCPDEGCPADRHTFHTMEACSVKCTPGKPSEDLTVTVIKSYACQEKQCLQCPDGGCPENLESFGSLQECSEKCGDSTAATGGASQNTSLFQCDPEAEYPCSPCPASGCPEHALAYTSSEECFAKCNPESCTANGKTLRVGDSVTEGQFQYECSQTKDVKVTGCITDNDTALLIGKVEVREGVLHQCIEFNGQAFYRTETFIAESSKPTLFRPRPSVGAAELSVAANSGAPSTGAPGDN